MVYDLYLNIKLLKKKQSKSSYNNNKTIVT